MEKFLDGKEFTFQRFPEEPRVPAWFVGFRSNGRVVIEYISSISAPLGGDVWTLITIDPDDKRLQVVKEKHIRWFNVYKHKINHVVTTWTYPTEDDAREASFRTSHQDIAVVVCARRIEIEED